MSLNKKKFKIYLFRHGQTEWNKAKRIQGHIDTDLNQMGREEAKGLAEKLRNIPLKLLYTSDLKRAFQTAEIVNKYHGLDLQKSQLLREAYGRGSGKNERGNY